MVRGSGLINLGDRPLEERKAIQAKGGRASSPKKTLAVTINGLIHNKNLSPEQRYFVALLKNNEFATAIRDMIILIATKAKTAEDWHKLLNQLIKMPFIEKVYNDLYKEKQRDVIPIVVEVLREHGQDELIGVIAQRLRQSGWGDTTRASYDPSVEVPEVRPEQEPTESQGRIVESQVDETITADDVLHVLDEDNLHEEKSEEEKE